MKKLKKVVSGLLVAVMFAALLAPAALAATKAGPVRDGNGVIVGWDVVGAKTGVHSRSAATSLIASGQGLLFELCYYGTGSETAGKGAMAFDTSVAASVTDFEPTSGTTRREITPIVYAILGTASATAGNNNLGCYKPAVAKRFYNGLVVEANDTGGIIMVSYRLDSAVNP